MISRSSMKRVLYLTMLAFPLACCLCLLLPASSYAHAFLLDTSLVESTMRRGGNLGESTGQVDSVTLFRLIMVILVILSSVFWVGAQLWHAFVFQSTNTDDINDIPRDRACPCPKALALRPARTGAALASPVPTEDRVELAVRGQALQDKDCEQRFTTRFALPALLLLFVACIGVLIGQGLFVSNGSFDQALSPALLINLASSGQFGLYWSLRTTLVLLALALATCALIYRKPSPIFAEVQSWANLLIALALLFATTSLEQTMTSANVSFTLVILSDWLHLLATSLWVGGMFYLSLVYLPLLRKLSLQEQAPALLQTLTRFSPFAITSAVLMIVTGALDVGMNLTSLDQLRQTAYARSLLVEAFLIVCLLLVSAIHLFLLRPHLAKTVQTYAIAKNSVTRSEVLELIPGSEVRTPEKLLAFSTSELKQLEGSIAIQTSRLACVVRWEPLLGAGILISMGLLTIFASTLQPAINLLPKNQAAHIQPFAATLKTTDHAYTLQLQVSPNHIGNNVFTIHVLDNHNQAVSNVSVTIYLSMLNMDMGVDIVPLQVVGSGVYSAPYQFTMAGGWQLLIKIRAPDSTMHETTIDLNTPF
jgi:copper transport protein